MSILISMILFGCSSLFSLLIFVGIVWFFFIKTKKSHQDFDSKADVFLDDISPKVLAWKNEALDDFSSELTFSGVNGLGKLRYQGTIKSLSQTDATGWLAFNMLFNFVKFKLKGTIALRTAKHSYELDVDKDNIPQIRVDGIPFGMMQVRGEKITFFGVDRRSVGSYHRHMPNKGFKIVTYKRYYRREKYFSTAYSPVKLHGKQIAEFNNNLVLEKHKAFLKDSMPSLYRNLAPDLSSEEVDWLMALLALEIYHRITRYLNDEVLDDRHMD